MCRCADFGGADFMNNKTHCKIEQKFIHIVRIKIKYAYICFMKSRLNLTIDESILNNVKVYAEEHRTSISELVEGYFEELTKPVKRKTFVDIVKELGKNDIDPKADLKKLYYQDPKHGG
ncbi:MAG: hypothetical protein JWQ63_3329 [Mucilaginibacter sp.]|nr:hypothetical protein [Mucilaginibacter sp.]